MDQLNAVVEWLSSAFAWAAPGIWSLVNSYFFLALVGAAAGAFGGALGAQYLSERRRWQENIIAEIRNTNAAIMTVTTITNLVIGLKRQHVRSLSEKHAADMKRFETFKKQKTAGEMPAGTVFQLTADFETLAPLDVPTAMMRDQIFEKLSVGARPLSMTIMLIQTIHSLNTVLASRNDLIEEWRQTGPHGHGGTILFYLGLAEGGNTDRRYAACVDAMRSYTDDSIFFGRTLCEDLMKHGEKLIAAAKKRSAAKAIPTVIKTDFSIADRDGLMPDAKEYESWTAGFVTPDPKKAS